MSSTATFWQLLQFAHDQKADLAELSITPSLPHIERAIHDPKVQELVKETVAIKERLQDTQPAVQKLTKPELVRRAILCDIQSYGARLAAAVDSDNIREAAGAATKLAELMDACGGGSICPIHEQYLARFLHAVATR